MLRLKGKKQRDGVDTAVHIGLEDPSSSESAPLAEPSKYDTAIGNEQSRTRWLETVVLGSESEFWKQLDEGQKRKRQESEDDETNATLDDVNEKEADEKKPVWEDEDDKALIDIPRKRRLADIVATMEPKDGRVEAKVYVDRLKKRFQGTASAANLGTPSWANLAHEKRRKKGSESDTDSEDEEGDNDHINDLTRRTGSYVTGDVKLTKGILQFKKLRDVTSGYRVKAILTSVEFNKQAPVLLVSGYTQRIQIFQIDGKDNSLLQSVTLDGFPIETAHFSADGSKVYAGSSLHDYFYYYDLMNGKVTKVPPIKRLNFMRMSNFVVSPDGKILAFRGPYGNIHLLSAKTYECICTLKMNGNSSSLAFSSNGSALYSHGYEGEVYVWDVRNRVCAHRFYDDGCVKGLDIETSPDDRYLAAGSNMGVVNVYEMDSIRNTSAPKPLKAIMNLTTAVKALRFNETSEILTLASDIKPKQLKLFHTRSLTTFENFPTLQDSMSLVQCMDFSPNSGYLCVGCQNGRASLYRLLHYASY